MKPLSNNPTFFIFRDAVTTFLIGIYSLLNCSLNHSPISCPLMASASFDLFAGSFTTWKPALSVVNFRLYSSLVSPKFLQVQNVGYLEGSRTGRISRRPSKISLNIHK